MVFFRKIMGSKEKDRCSRLYAELESAQVGVLDKYLLDIRSSYEELGSVEERSDFLGRLEKGVAYFGNPKNPKIFDRERASEIRKEAGFSVKDLVAELAKSETKKTVNNMITDYEAGRRVPEKPPRTDVQCRYIDWLEERGDVFIF
jgi:hypothetical protein